MPKEFQLKIHYDTTRNTRTVQAIATTKGHGTSPKTTRQVNVAVEHGVAGNGFSVRPLEQVSAGGQAIAITIPAGTELRMIRAMGTIGKEIAAYLAWQEGKDLLVGYQPSREAHAQVAKGMRVLFPYMRGDHARFFAGELKSRHAHFFAKANEGGRANAPRDVRK